MTDLLGISVVEAGAVVVSAIGIAVAFLLLLRLLGQRTAARLSTFDVAVLLVLGSVGGRVITGYTPTSAGVIALVTLAVLRWCADKVSWTRWGAFIMRDQAVLLVRGEQILDQNLRRAHLSREELWESLRLAGIRNLTEVSVVVLESNGAISVLRAGAPLDQRLLDGITS